MRHGHRNPVKPFKNDPLYDEKNWPGGYGELTDVRKSKFFLNLKNFTFVFDFRSGSDNSNYWENTCAADIINWFRMDIQRKKL